MTALEEWLLKNYGQEQYTPGLERMSAALKDVDLSFARKVTIAGTNGKGETTHRLSSAFLTSTFCTWTSPHISCLTERFRSEKGNISLPELEAQIQKAHAQVQQEKFKLTYYEFLFYVFCRWASERKPSFLFLEVGLGGRLDAVNVLDAELVLLTSISRDHQEYLGPRLDGILMEKLGVVRSGAKVLSFLELEYLRSRAERICQSRGAEYCDLSKLSVLPGFAFSARNQLLAHAAFQLLNRQPLRLDGFEALAQPLSDRGEVIRGRNEWHLYGSHNPDGVRKLIQFLHSENYNFVITSFSRRPRQDVVTMLRMLKRGCSTTVLVTAFDHPKAYPVEGLAALAQEEGLDFVSDLTDHVQKWNNQKCLVVGSYYFLGQLKPFLRHH